MAVPMLLWVDSSIMHCSFLAGRWRLQLGISNMDEIMKQVVAVPPESDGWLVRWIFTFAAARIRADIHLHLEPSMT